MIYLLSDGALSVRDWCRTAFGPLRVWVVSDCYPVYPNRLFLCWTPLVCCPAGDCTHSLLTCPSAVVREAAVIDAWCDHWNRLAQGDNAENRLHCRPRATLAKCVGHTVSTITQTKLTPTSLPLTEYLPTGHLYLGDVNCCTHCLGGYPVTPLPTTTSPHDCLSCYGCGVPCDYDFVFDLTDDVLLPHWTNAHALRTKWNVL